MPPGNWSSRRTTASPLVPRANHSWREEFQIAANSVNHLTSTLRLSTTADSVGGQRTKSRWHGSGSSRGRDEAADQAADISAQGLQASVWAFSDSEPNKCNVRFARLSGACFRATIQQFFDLAKIKFECRVLLTFAANLSSQRHKQALCARDVTFGKILNCKAYCTSGSYNEVGETNGLQAIECDLKFRSFVMSNCKYGKDPICDIELHFLSWGIGCCDGREVMILDRDEIRRDFFGAHSIGGDAGLTQHRIQDLPIFWYIATLLGHSDPESIAAGDGPNLRNQAFRQFQ